MKKMVLYHGSPLASFIPEYGQGNDRHDYGRGFYLTEDIELAKEWAGNFLFTDQGWVHKYELDMTGLNILNFRNHGVLAWIAELMKHRPAADSRRYKLLAGKFIEKYGVDSSLADVIIGRRADDSYFYIAKAFVRDEIDVSILEELLCLGELGFQVCLKSPKAFAQLTEKAEEVFSVDMAEYRSRFSLRDRQARIRMKELVDSDANPAEHVFSTLL